MLEKSTHKNEVIIHFDVDTHRIPFNQFFQTGNSTKSIVDEINRNLFDSKLKYKLFVTPPEKGGLIEGLLISLTFVGPIFAFIASGPGQNFIEGLTGKDTNYWFKAGGIKLKEYWIDENGTLYFTGLDDKKKKATKKQQKEIASIIIAKIVSSFLEKKYSELVKTGIYKSKYKTAYKAKNQIFEDCLRNKEINGIGFDKSHVFPISREDFYSQIEQLPDEEEDEELIEWEVETKNLIANSPNWKRDGRSWQGIDSNKKNVNFIIEDENFWHKVKLKNINLDINDNIEVQWAHPKHAATSSQKRVLKVLSYNGKQVSKPYSHQELEKILNSSELNEITSIDLFNVS